MLKLTKLTAIHKYAQCIAHIIFVVLYLNAGAVQPIVTVIVYFQCATPAKCCTKAKEKQLSDLGHCYGM